MYLKTKPLKATACRGFSLVPQPVGCRTRQMRHATYSAAGAAGAAGAASSSLSSLPPAFTGATANAGLASPPWATNNALGQSNVGQMDSCASFQILQIDLDRGGKISRQAANCKLGQQVADNGLAHFYRRRVLAIDKVQRHLGCESFRSHRRAGSQRAELAVCTGAIERNAAEPVRPCRPAPCLESTRGTLPCAGHGRFHYWSSSMFKGCALPP